MVEDAGPQSIDERLYRYRCGLDHRAMMLDDALRWTAVHEGGKNVVALATFHTVMLHELGVGEAIFLREDRPALPPALLDQFV